MGSNSEFPLYEIFKEVSSLSGHLYSIKSSLEQIEKDSIKIYYTSDNAAEVLYHRDLVNSCFYIRRDINDIVETTYSPLYIDLCTTEMSHETIRERVGELRRRIRYLKDLI